MKFLKKNWGTTKPSVGYGVDWSDSISKGLVGCWLFNEGAGAFAFDIARKNKGTLTNGPTWTSGKFGKGLSFDGTNDYVRLVGLNIAAASDFTFCTWVYPTAWVGNNPGIWRDNTSSNGNSFNIFQSNTGRPWIRWNGADILKPLSGYGVPLNQWTYVCYTVQSSANANFYANGVLKHSATHTTATPAFTIYNLGYQTTVGERINGTYDDFRIYDRALSAGEVKRLYSEPFAGILSPVQRRINSVSAEVLATLTRKLHIWW